MVGNIISTILLVFVLSKTSSTATPKGLDIEKFNEQNLVCHNKYRAKHGVKALSYNDQLNNIAQKYAEHLAEKDGGLVHSSNVFGENLYSSRGLIVDGYSACSSWYDEIKDYNYDRDQPKNLKDVGHFTALVWKGTCFMGVGIATSKSGYTYIVTNYDPPGNVRDKFRKNVFKPGTPSKSIKTMSPFELLMSEDKVICSDVDRDTFLKQNLECHNTVRQRHGVPPLSYSKEMNEYAMKQVEIFAKAEKLIKNANYGVNSYIASGGKMDGYSACKSWYQESNQYNYNTETNPSNTIPFTQMVWKSSRLTGIGFTRSDSGKIFVISIYDPPGSIKGLFKDNVLPPVIGNNTVTSAVQSATSLGVVPIKKKSIVDMEKFKEHNLVCHNKYREKHGVKSLSYKDQLNNIAQKYAEHLAEKDGGLVHSSNVFGENLYSSRGLIVDGYSACSSWYDEIQDYNYERDQPNNLKDVGHFTALVWKGTCFMGVGIATSKSGYTYIVTNYDPPGNVRDKFRKNVFKPGTPSKSIKTMSPFELLMSEDKVICSDVDRDTFLKQNLECHNTVRQRHGVPPLSYSKEMNEYAMKQVEIFAMAGKLINNSKYGVNSYIASGGKMDGYSACKSWYQESNQYNYNTETNPSNTIPFTQMVWKSSRLTGIGFTRSDSGKIFVISIYDPPGSIKGLFKDNVLPPVIGNNTVTSAVQSTTGLGVVPIKKKSIVDMEKFKEHNLVCHNKYREKHGVNSLSYKDQLNNIAQKYAEHLAEKDGGLVHSSNVFGKNLYSSRGLIVDGYSACSSWYDEIKDYNYDRDQPKNLKAVGHFTALVWKGTCFMGVGIATSKSGYTYIVTNYDPPGNVRDKFRKNVFRPGTPPKSNKTMSPFELLMSEDKVICSDADRDTFLKQNLECHNTVRQRHGVPPLSYSKQMNDYAMKHVEIFAKAEILIKHGKYGVNSYIASGGKMDGYSACKSWYQESNQYNYNTETNPSNTIPFTQMVWKSSRFTGIGITRSDSGKLFVISIYDPPGNYKGLFKINVLPPVLGNDTGTLAVQSTTGVGIMSLEITPTPYSLDHASYTPTLKATPNSHHFYPYHLYLYYPHYFFSHCRYPYHLHPHYLYYHYLYPHYLYSLQVYHHHLCASRFTTAWRHTI